MNVTMHHVFASKELQESSPSVADVRKLDTAALFANNWTGRTINGTAGSKLAGHQLPTISEGGLIGDQQKKNWLDRNVHSVSATCET